MNRLLPYKVAFLYPFHPTLNQQGALFTVCRQNQAYSNQAFRSKNNQMNYDYQYFSTLIILLSSTVPISTV